jgi:hypothetical protein
MNIAINISLNPDQRKCGEERRELLKGKRNK